MHSLHWDVLWVGSQMYLLQSVLQELRTGIHIDQLQDNQITGQASNIFQRYCSDMHTMCNRHMDNVVQFLAKRGTNDVVQKNVKQLLKEIENVNIILSSLTWSLKELPLPKELHNHATKMENEIVRIEEVNTAVTSGLEDNKLSESSKYNFQ